MTVLAGQFVDASGDHDRLADFPPTFETPTPRAAAATIPLKRRAPSPIIVPTLPRRALTERPPRRATHHRGTHEVPDRGHVRRRRARPRPQTAAGAAAGLLP